MCPKILEEGGTPSRSKPTQSTLSKANQKSNPNAEACNKLSQHVVRSEILYHLDQGCPTQIFEEPIMAAPELIYQKYYIKNNKKYVLIYDFITKKKLLGAASGSGAAGWTALI